MIYRRSFLRDATIGSVAAALMLLLAATASATVRCVAGTMTPPSQCLTYQDIYRAQAESAPADEVRIYGTVPVPSTLILQARKLTGVTVQGIRATLDGRLNPGVVVSVNDLDTNFLIQTLDILTSGRPDGVGIEFSQPGLVTTNGIAIIGPPGGAGIGIDLRPGVGRVTMHGMVYPSTISGQEIGIRSTDPKGRPSPNGVDISDIRVGIESIATPLAQWFHADITCGRPNSIGFRSVAEHADHNGLSITQCSVGIQIECLDGVCGWGNEWDFLAIETATCPDSDGGCIAVRVIGLDGSAVDDYRAGSSCGDTWGRSDMIDGVHIQDYAKQC